MRGAVRTELTHFYSALLSMVNAGAKAGLERLVARPETARLRIRTIPSACEAFQSANWEVA